MNAEEKKIYKIVVLDDEVEIASILEVFLKKRGFEVTVFHDGQTAMEYVKAGSPVDLMVLDIKMPNMTGVEVLKELRAAHAQFPIVILSGSIGIQENARDLLELGYDESDVLDKPIDLNELLAAVKKELSIDSE
jgi:DNA-binding response OmpR family regulator